MQKIMNHMERLRLGTKLLMGFGFVLFIFLLVGIYSLYSLAEVRSKTKQLYEDDLIGISHIKEANINLIYIERSLRQMGLAPDSTQREIAKKRLELARLTLKNEFDEGRKKIFLEENIKRAQEFEVLYEQYLRNVDQAITIIESEKTFSMAQISRYLTNEGFTTDSNKAQDMLTAIARSKENGAKQFMQEVESAYEKALLLSVVLFACGLLCGSVFALLIKRSIRHTLNNVSSSIEDVAAGRLDITVPYLDYNNEIGDIAKSVKLLQQSAQISATERWVKERLAEIDKVVQSALTFEDFADALAARLAPTMDLVYVALYIADVDKTQLQRVGGYGCDDTLHSNHFAFGSGLIGQAALDQRQISLTLADEDGIGVSMGLGKMTVHSVLISPILDRENVLAVLEVGALKPFDSRQMLFFDTLLPDMAGKLQILAGNVATRELLNKTQAQAEALTASEIQLLARRDELEENNKKLAEQAQALEQQAEELESQKSTLLEQREELESSKKVLAQTEERTRLILGAVGDGIVGLDTDGKITFANPAVSALLGYTDDELLGQAMHPLVHYAYPDGRDLPRAQCPMYLTARDGKTRVVDNEVLWCKDGGALPVEYATTPVYKDGQLTGSVIVFRDITERKAAEKAIAEQRAALQNILDHSPVGTAFTTKGVFGYTNPEFEKMFDVRVGDPAQNIYEKPEDRAELLEEIKRNGIVRNREMKMVSAGGELRDYLTTFVPFVHDGKEGLMGWLLDITERKQAEDSIKHVNFLNDQALGLTKAGYWHVPLDGSGWYISSKRAADIFGDIPNENYRYRVAEDWFANVEAGDPEYAKATGKNFQEAIEGKIPAYDSIYAYKRPVDGRIVWIHAYGTVARDAEGKPTNMYGVTQDITEYIHAQQELAKAKEIAEEATKAKSDFLANMSHEIRTPMNAIIGMSHLALQTELNSKQRNYIEKVDSAAHNLLGIINDILDFSKIEAGKMSMEKVDFYLEDVMEHLADLSVIKAQDKGLELLFDVGTDVPTALIGDPLRLGQVVINLVNNAIKFTEKGEITVGVHKIADEADGVRLRFDVRDTGIGLTEEQRNKLFTAFSQADASTTRKYGGTGLGLTISKKLVGMMDGEIGVDSEAGKGSTFHFTAKFGVQSEQRHLSVNAEDVRGLRILVVDDNASAREILQNILQSLKFDATAVSSGSQAIGELEQAHIEHRPYGLVLMDWMMPGMDGVETIKRIRSDSSLSKIPAFVMVTAYSREELLQKAEGVQIDGVLVKPVSPSTMLDSILNALGKEVALSSRKHEKQSSYQEAARLVKGAYLLLVEDNAVNQELALEILQDAGLKVDVANNGAEAIEKVSQVHYDGVLMDCQMPVMDGFEATRKIRQDGRFADLPILAMTANAMAGDKEKCVESGMNDHIAKPIDVSQLFLTLAHWIKPKQADVQTETVKHESSTEGIPTIQGLDIDNALVRMGGSVKMLRKMISRFRETQSDVMSRIKAALDNRDVETAVREAHTVKGLSGNIGANEMAQRAALVEGMLKRGETEGLADALHAMETELTSQLTHISAAIGEPETAQLASSARVAVDKDGLAIDLRKLAALLADLDSSSGSMVEKLSPQLNALGQGLAARNLLKLVGEFEFEDALKCVQETAGTLGVAL